jgi:hypothetical protein
MKRLINYSLLLPILAFTTGTCLAQTASTSNDIDAKFAAITVPSMENTAPTKVSEPATAGNEKNGLPAPAINDGVPPMTVANFGIALNQASGMMTIKTECAGQVHFYSLKGKERGACCVHEGANVIFMESLINPGTYICRFDGVNRSSGTVQVMYKPGEGIDEEWSGRKF